MKKDERSVARKAIGIAALGILLTIGNTHANSVSIERNIPVPSAVFYSMEPAGIQQSGDEKAREKAKKRYEREQKKIAKKARKIAKQKARIEKIDRKIEKIERDLEKQKRKVDGLERELLQASDRSGTTDVALSSMRVKLNKERLKHSKLDNSLHKEKRKLERALKKVAK